METCSLYAFPFVFLTTLRHAFCAAQHIGITLVFISCDKHRHSLDHKRQTQPLATYRTWKPANIIHYFHHLFPIISAVIFPAASKLCSTLKTIELERYQNAAAITANYSPFTSYTTLQASLSHCPPAPHLPTTMTDFEVRQRLQTSTFGEGRQLMKWVNSLEVAERLGDPSLAMAPVGTTVIRSAPWAIYPGVSMNVPAMTASIHVADRNEVDTILSLAVKHPSYQQLAVILRMSISNDILRACTPSSRKTLAHHLVAAMCAGLSSTGTISIRGPVLTTHPVSNQQLYRRDAWLEETVQGKTRKREFLFSYGA